MSHYHTISGVTDYSSGLDHQHHYSSKTNADSFDLDNPEFHDHFIDLSLEKVNGHTHHVMGITLDMLRKGNGHYHTYRIITTPGFYDGIHKHELEWHTGFEEESK